MTEQTMTAKERSDLQQLARMNARVAKGDVEAVGAVTDFLGADSARD